MNMESFYPGNYADITEKAFFMTTERIGFHLRSKYWRQGDAKEAAEAVIRYAFTALSVQRLFAGHNSKNTALQKLCADRSILPVL